MDILLTAIANFITEHWFLSFLILVLVLGDPLKVEFDTPDYWDTVWDVTCLRCRLMGSEI